MQRFRLVPILTSSLILYIFFSAAVLCCIISHGLSQRMEVLPLW
jgi:hypothetical protein